MPLKTKKKEKVRGGAAAGAVWGIAATVILVALYSIIIDSKPELSENADIAITVINVIGALICGGCAARGRTKRRAAVGTAAGAIYFLTVLFAALAISADNINASGLCEIALICLVGSAAGAMLNLCRSNKKLRNKRNRR
ncbi:MAG: TIGR04086 family membrane protein [Bacillota bacterium]|nr:TIGR04086 family membrane protein [Bacillota bacterium]